MASHPKGPEGPGRVEIGGKSVRQKALAMRIAGASYQQIGAALHITDTSAHRHVQKALERIDSKTAELAEQVRAMELKRLDALMVGIWKEAVGPDGTMGDPKAVETVLKVMDRRARLLGLDAAQKSEVRIDELTDEQRAARVAALFDAARARRDGQATPASDAGADGVHPGDIAEVHGAAAPDAAGEDPGDGD